MTKEQFIRKLADFEKRDRRFNLIHIMIFISLLIVSIPLSYYIPASYNTLFIVALLVLLIGNAVFMLSRGLNDATPEGLICRSCKGGLLGSQGKLAITTGNCGHCGEQAFDP